MKNNISDKFLANGWLDLGYSIDKKKCVSIANKVLKSRAWDKTMDLILLKLLI